MAFQYVLVKNSGRGRGYLPTIMPEASINDPINDTSKTDNHYYDVSYSVKTIAPAWIAGNGKNEGLWVNSKSEFYNLIKNNDQYILNRVGGL